MGKYPCALLLINCTGWGELSFFHLIERLLSCYTFIYKGMVRVELTNEDAKLVADWLAESFWRLEIGGTHRLAAVRFYDQLVKKEIGL